MQPRRGLIAAGQWQLRLEWRFSSLSITFFGFDTLAINSLAGRCLTGNRRETSLTIKLLPKYVGGLCCWSGAGAEPRSTPGFWPVAVGETGAWCEPHVLKHGAGHRQDQGTAAGPGVLFSSPGQARARRRPLRGRAQDRAVALMSKDSPKAGELYP